MKKTRLLWLLLCAAPAWAAGVAEGNIPPASEVFRAKLVKEDSPACIAGIEAEPDLRAIYSHKTVSAYCACRAKRRADVIEQANARGQRGKAVSEKSHQYATEQCKYILLDQLEHE